MSNAAYQQTLRLAMAGVRAPLPAELTALADGLAPTGAPAAQLLALASLLGQAERCARPVPGFSGKLADPTPEDARACLGPERGRVLALALQGKSNSLLAELLAWCAQRQLRLPDWALPDLLTLMAKSAELRSDTALTVMGARGAWLAAQNPAWASLLLGQIPPEDAHWQEGSLDERSAWLRQQRQTDVDAARTALLAVWAAEPPDARARFLADLRIGLSLADEALLETARKDKRKEVRSIALELLARLPESAWAQAQRARLKTWLVISPGGFLRKPKLEVQLAEAWDKSWAFDGLTEKSTRVHEKIGDKANWLLDTLANVPLPQLLAAYALDAREWFALISQSEFKTALILGTLASLERAPSFATVIAAAEADVGSLYALMRIALLCPAQDLARKPDWAQSWLERTPLILAVNLPLIDAHQPLPLKMQEALFRAFRNEALTRSGRNMQLLEAMRALVRALAPPLLLPLYELLQTLQDDANFVLDLQTDDLLTLLQLRLQLHAP